MKLIIDGGHISGNHSYSHPDGWRTSGRDYLADIASADRYTSASLFRPPYGRLSPCKYRALKNRYRIFFWDVMPYDFDRRFGSINSLLVLKRMIRPGSVIVLHDAATATATEILPEFIEYALDNGYSFICPF